MGQGRRPRLAEREVTPKARRETRPAAPLPVTVALRQQPGPPALRRDARPFAGYHRRRRVRQVAQHLPADCRVRFEQPVDHVHYGTVPRVPAEAAAAVEGSRTGDDPPDRIIVPGLP